MLNRLKSLLKTKNKKHSKSTVEKQVIPQQEHGINERLISHAALKVMRGLHAAGYEAYLVGGGVRDLLLEGKPKDFDVATNARPEQVKTVFRSARIIGRRFQIVHVRFGREIIEVTTFRGSHKDAPKNIKANDKQGSNRALSSDKGILLRDNVYGDLESDALRRDFTVNALYYDCKTQEVIDYTQGMRDLKQRRLTIIGNAQTRYKEDPVRMLRAVRFTCKLGFTMESDTEKNIHDHSDYLAEIPSARLFEEVLKLFTSGYATASLHRLSDFSLLEHLFPGLDQCMKEGSEFDTRFAEDATTNTDKRIRQGKSITPAFIYAAFLWLPLQAAMRQLREENARITTNEALYQAAQGVISQQLAITSIPKRFLIPMREIWNLQYRFEKRGGKRATSYLNNPRFRAAYDFLLLREQAGEQTGGLGEWWTRFQFASQEDQEAMVNALEPERKQRRRRKKRPKKITTAESNTNQNDV